MKINEFRVLLQKAGRSQLETIAGELYKKMSKAQKEELDEAIQQILNGETPAAKSRQFRSLFPNYPRRFKLSYRTLTRAITTRRTASYRNKNAPNGVLRSCGS